MIKRLVAFSILFLTNVVASAQFTSVTATVTDLDGQTWNNGTWQVSLYNPYPQSPASINGTPLTPSQLQQKGSLNSSGVLSVSLADNSIVAPTGTYWVFTLCPNASAQCAIVNSPVSGTSLNLSSVLSANLNGPRFTANSINGGSWGYLDAEVKPTPNAGGQYYNVSSACQRIWNGSAWSCLSTSSGFALNVNGSPVTSPGNLQNSATVTWNLISGTNIQATATATSGCNPSGSVGSFLVDTGSHTCTNAPVIYNSGANSLTTTIGTETDTVSGTKTISASSMNTSVTGTSTESASGMSKVSNSGIAVTDSSSNNIAIHEQGTSAINITADLGPVNIVGTTVNANGFSICTQASGCPSTSIGTNYYWTDVGCHNGTGQPVQCLATTTLPGNMPDASYQLFCTADSTNQVGDYVCIMSNASLPTTAGSTISYRIVQVMQNGGGGGTPNVYFHAHHN